MWDIHFENVALTSESVEGTLPTIDSDKTTINFTANLNKPGDKYEFTVDVVNAGTIDALVNVFHSSGSNSYLDIDYTYLSGLEIEQRDLLSAGSRETILVSVTFKKNITANQLPTEDTNGIEGTIEIDYIPTKSSYNAPFDINAPVTVVFHRSDHEIYFADENGNQLDIETVTLNISDDYDDYDAFVNDINNQLGQVKKMVWFDNNYYPSCGSHEAIIMGDPYGNHNYVMDFYFTDLATYEENGTKYLYNDYIQRINRLGLHESTIDVYAEHIWIDERCGGN